MNGTIVVGMTESCGARHALDWAAQRAADRRQRLILVSVVGGAVGVVGEGPIVQSAIEATRAFLTDEAARVSADAVEVRRGRPVDELIDASEDADLLVIGSDYAGPGSKSPRGFHGIRIAAGARCPVVVVPHQEKVSRSGVVVGVDGSEISESAIAFAAAEADRLREPLIAVSAWSPIPIPRGSGVYPSDYLENMGKLTEEMQALSLAGLRQDYPDLEIRRVVEMGWPPAIIHREAAGSRLAVVGSHGRGPIARFLLGSVSAEVLARLNTVTAVVR